MKQIYDYREIKKGGYYMWYSDFSKEEKWFWICLKVDFQEDYLKRSLLRPNKKEFVEQMRTIINYPASKEEGNFFELTEEEFNSMIVLKEL